MLQFLWIAGNVTTCFFYLQADYDFSPACKQYSAMGYVVSVSSSTWELLFEFHMTAVFWSKFLLINFLIFA